MPPKRRGRGGGRGPGRPKKVKKAETDSEVEASSSDDEKGFSKDKFLSVLRYDFDRLISTKSFEHKNLIGKIDPESFNIDYYEETGLETPLFFQCDPKKLGMKVPDSESFTVNTVLELVGGDRVIEVVEVSGQTSVKMNLKEFVDYYNTPKEKRNTLYNVLSLEFTLDKLRDVVQGPSLVRDVDWVENCWPDALHQRFISFTKKGYQLHHTFPKVQNYCLMSVERCYTDFHIDFGGTSVWYHVLKGQKIFWMVEPTEANIRVYEEFIKNPEQTGFFGDVVDRCVRVVLKPGDTMIIPSGWIHAVFTPVDSLVFGGNFLHSLRASMQIRVFQSENRISVTKKFRFPYLDQLIFYVISQVVEEVTGRKYARPLHIRDAKLDYVGKLWIKQNGHHKLIKSENFQTDVNTSDILEEEANHEPGSKNVIAMHAENTIYDAKVSESDVVVSDVPEDKERPSEMEIMSKGIFYHEQSPLFDLHGKSTAAHKNPVGDEPEIVFNDDVLNHMSVKRLVEYEKLCDYMRKKRLVEVAEGITKPASLLQVFQLVLTRRRTHLDEEGVVMESAPWASKRKRAYKRTSNHEAMQVDESFEAKVANHPTTSEGDLKEEESDATSIKNTPKKEETETETEDDSQKVDEEMEIEAKTVLDPISEGASKKEDVASEVSKLEEKPEEILDLKKEEELEECAIEKSKDDELEDKKSEEPHTEEKDNKDTSASEKTVEVASAKEETAAKVSSKRKDSEGASTEVKESDDKSDHEKNETTEAVAEEVPESEAPTHEKSETTKDSKKSRAKPERKSSRKSDHGTDRSFEEALMANVKPKRRSDSKKEKPLFAGGIPLLPLLEDEPVVPNPYNYDPKAEIMKLGTGQLKSAYRKSKTNIEPPKEKKIYKLEHKIHEEERNESPLNSPELPAPVKDFMKSNYFSRETAEPPPVKKLSSDSYTERNSEQSIKKPVEKTSLHASYTPNKPKVEESVWKSPVVSEKPSQHSPVIHHRPIDPRIPEPVKPIDTRPSDPRKPVETKKLIPAAIAITKLGEVVRQLESLNNQWK
ncbi:unnamed protein product [Auanema sp. JU1783]|nr:unnamed protein product [Auanema sp. JU1783]